MLCFNNNDKSYLQPPFRRTALPATYAATRSLNRCDNRSLASSRKFASLSKSASVCATRPPYTHDACASLPVPLCRGRRRSVRFALSVHVVVSRLTQPLRRRNGDRTSIYTSFEACLAPYIGQNANSTRTDRMYHGLKFVSASHVYPCETRTLPCRPLERQSARSVRKPRQVLDRTMIVCSISAVFSLSSDHSTGSFSFREPECTFLNASIATFPFLGCSRGSTS